MYACEGRIFPAVVSLYYCVFSNNIKGQPLSVFQSAALPPRFQRLWPGCSQCGTWKREGKIHICTIEVQFSYRKTAVHMRGG